MTTQSQTALTVYNGFTFFGASSDAAASLIFHIYDPFTCKVQSTTKGNAFLALASGLVFVGVTNTGLTTCTPSLQNVDDTFILSDEQRGLLALTMDRSLPLGGFQALMVLVILSDSPIIFFEYWKILANYRRLTPAEHDFFMMAIASWEITNGTWVFKYSKEALVYGGIIDTVTSHDVTTELMSYPEIKRILDQEITIHFTKHQESMKVAKSGPKAKPIYNIVNTGRRNQLTKPTFMRVISELSARGAVITYADSITKKMVDNDDIIEAWLRVNSTPMLFGRIQLSDAKYSGPILVKGKFLTLVPVFPNEIIDSIVTH